MSKISQNYKELKADIISPVTSPDDVIWNEGVALSIDMFEKQCPPAIAAKLRMGHEC